MTKYFLELPELLQRKRAEWMNNISKLNQGLETKLGSNYTCHLCGESLEIGAHNKAINHFSLHIWCDYTEQIHKNGKSMEEYAQQNEIISKFLAKYGMKTWLAHHKAEFGTHEEKYEQIQVKFKNR